MSKKKKEYGHALTWKELADEYSKIHSGSPYIMEMDTVFKRMENTKGFKVFEDGSIHKRILS